MSNVTHNLTLTAKKQRGLAIAEMTLVLPLLLLLLLAVSEVGRILYLYNSLTQAQRDGARYLAANAFKGSTQVIELVEATGANADRTRNLIVYGNETGSGTPLLKDLSRADITLSVVNSTHIRVDVAYNFTPIWGGTLPTFGYGPDINVSFPLRSSMVMRAL